MTVKRTIRKRVRSNAARINIPALNTVRREYLLGLARKYEDEVGRVNSLLGVRPGRDFTQWTFRRRQCLKIAAIYREMADFAFSGDDPEALSEKEKLAAKLRAMTVANGCTEAEAETAQMMLFRLEADEAIPCTSTALDT
jgi:hypothetical protein